MDWPSPSARWRGGVPRRAVFVGGGDSTIDGFEQRLDIPVSVVGSHENAMGRVALNKQATDAARILKAAAEVTTP